MKSSHLLIALLAGASLPSAWAQSSLQLYGIADSWVGRVSTKGGANPGPQGLMVESGGGQASRWGLRGTEDLGGGLRAHFRLEQGIALDTGTTSRVSGSDQGFNRGAYVALSGGFGEVRLGRMLTAFDALRGSTNQLYDSSGFASTGQVWGAGTSAENGLAAVAGSDYLARGNNTLYYGTPKKSPFRASISYSGDDEPSTATAGPRMLTGHVEYANEALRVGYGFQTERYATGRNNFHIVAGHYKFSLARMVFAVQRQTDERPAGELKSREWQLGLDAPFGAATVALGYAASKTKTGAGDKASDARGFSAMATYDLSKRTRLYTAYRNLKTERGDGSRSLAATRLGMGVTHQF